MAEASSERRSTQPWGARDGEAGPPEVALPEVALPEVALPEVALPSPATVTARPPHPATPPRPATAPAAPERPGYVMRYGPGVPATPPGSSAGQTAERIWRTGTLPEPPRRRVRLRRMLGTALTVILLAASGVVLYLRFYHPPFHVTAAVISQQTKTGCGVNVTGRITTNGSAGTVSYQWLFRGDRQAPQPLSQSVVAGQHAVYVTVAVEGSGHGSASQTVTLQVLGPDPEAASASVVVSCP
jgi:hypothetical protein